MAASSRLVKGTVTTDGAGAGSASIVTTGYRIRGITVRNIGLTGGTISAKDNNGAGSELLPATAQPAPALRRTYGAPTAATSPLLIAVTGGGATKQFRYEVELSRIPAGAQSSYLAGISGLFAWYDFTDRATLFTDTGRTTLAADGQTVKGVTDKSGAGNHLSEATNPPLLVVDGVGGRPHLLFDGTNDKLDTGALVQAQPYTIFAVARVDAVVGFARVMVGGVTNDTAMFAQITAGTHSSFYGSTVNGSGGNRVGVPHIFVDKVNGASSKAWTDGVTEYTTNPGATGISGLRVGAGIGPVNFMKGPISEVLVFSGALAVADINTIGFQLKSKFGADWITAT